MSGSKQREERAIQRRADGDFKLVQLPVLITVEAHPMTDGRTYLVRTAPNFSFTAIADDECDFAEVGRQCGKFFDYALGGDLASAIEAATAGETTKIGSTEGESAVAESETPKPSRKEGP